MPARMLSRCACVQLNNRMDIAQRLLVSDVELQAVPPERGAGPPQAAPRLSNPCLLDTPPAPPEADHIAHSVAAARQWAARLQCDRAI